jgi:hypothetical protein
MSTELLESPQVPAPVPFNTKPVVYGVADKRIAELSAMYMNLKVQGIDDKTGLSVVHQARITIRDYRVDIEKTRKELKADALKYGQTVDAEAKRLTALLDPIEKHLQAEEDRVAAEKKRIREEADRKRHEATLARMNALLAVGCTAWNYVQVQDMADDVFAKALADATEAHRVKQEEERKAREYAEQLAETERQRKEAERLEQERIRAEEDQRRKEEAKQLAKERAELERQKAEEVRRQRVINGRLLAAYAVDWHPSAEAIGSLSDDDFKNQLADASGLFTNKQNQARIAQEKAASERAELDRQRREQEAEAARLAAERRRLEEAEQQRIREEQEAKARAEAAERARIEAEQRAAQEAKEEAERLANSDPINYAGGFLPDGWTIKLEVERGSHSVGLIDPVGDDAEFQSDHEDWQQAVRDAVKHAQEHDGAFA